jgi:hypothetical protein
VRIVLANQPRCYREAMTAVIQALRPEADVRALEPDGLARDVQAFSPQLVICSDPMTVLNDVPSWVVLHPDGRTCAVSHVGGKTCIVADCGLSDILAFVDGAAQALGQQELPVFS